MSSVKEIIGYGIALVVIGVFLGYAIFFIHGFTKIGKDKVVQMARRDREQLKAGMDRHEVPGRPVDHGQDSRPVQRSTAPHLGQGRAVDHPTSDHPNF